MHKEIQKDLAKLFETDSQVLVAYVFGSRATGHVTAERDFDIAVLLSQKPEKLLDYYLRTLDNLSKILGDNVDLVILNTAPPLLKHQVIKHGKPVYIRDEKARITFEARVISEYLDFSIKVKRYDECLINQTLA